jgi:alkyl sulfatase BDS1-like metallo-beta-lactamase superfamily hydrolase
LKVYSIVPTFHLLITLAAFLVLGLGINYAQAQEGAGPKEATGSTKAANAKVLQELPFADKHDFADAKRGFIAPLPDNGVIKNAQGRAVWDLTKFSFIKEDAPAPDTVNPSLWRQCQLVIQGGLYKVVDGLYQVRTADLSNLTIFEGKDGIVVADPLISAETAKAALDLYYQHRPHKPVVAVVHSHSHVDHFGGVRGVVKEEDVRAGKVKIVAPVGFLEAAIAENVLAGNAMSRRASYMYGNLLPPGPKGQVGAGLGVTTSTGTVTLIPPTHLITKTGQKMKIAGLDFEFMLAPDTEAPAEMHWYIKQFKAVTAAENCCHTLHNTYSLRGAKIRDPLAWSKYLQETIDLWGDKAEVMYGMHHWPVWGKARVLEMLQKGRDGYRFINDQTLRLANEGYTMVEIAEMLEFPKGLAQHFALRGYYGTLNHNVKATYVKYLGWFDGNPAHLHGLPPVEASKKYVEFMGGAGAVLKKAQEAYNKGEYRWVAEVVNRVVFADPNNQAARKLQADVLEQLGYRAESGPWRNFYLTGAQELRQGVQKLPTPGTTSADIIKVMPLDLFFDYLGIRLNAPKADGKKITLNFNFPDIKEKYVLALENGALNHTRGSVGSGADATITMDRAVLNRIILGQSTLKQEIGGGAVKIQGKKEALGEMFSLFDKFEFWFNIVTP